MAKEAYYFSHDSNARHDPKITAMRSVYGSEGYGWFWVLVEMMRETDEYKLDMRGKYTFNAYAMQMHTERNTAEQFVLDCINEFELFSSDGDFFWSNSLLRRMEKREIVKAKRSAAAKARWDKEKQESNPSENSDDMQMHSISNTNGMQGKESKVKENKKKIKEITTTQFDDFDDDDDFKKVNDAYQRIHGVTGIKPKDWPIVTRILKEAPVETVISVMEERFEKKASEGGEVNSFAYYEKAIRDRVSGRLSGKGHTSYLEEMRKELERNGKASGL